MERKRFDSSNSWSMILESENIETWEVSKEDQKDWTSYLSQLFIGNKFASRAHSRIYLGIYKQRVVAVKMVRIPTHNQETRALLEQQFKSEVALLSRLYHPSIVHLVHSNSRRFMPSQADEEAHQLSYLQKHVGNIVSLLSDSTEGERR